MFKQLAPIVKSTELNLTIKAAADGDKLTIIIIPKPKPGAHEALAKILTFTETPEVLDEKLPALLNEYTKGRLSLEETVAETTAYMALAKKDVEATANKAVSKPTTEPKSTAETADDEEVDIEALGDNEVIHVGIEQGKEPVLNF